MQKYRMKIKEITNEEPLEEDIESLFEMANLEPKYTGLPMVVWANPRGGARHDVRIKVNMTHGNNMNPTNLAVVSVRPAPELLAGNLSRSDLTQVKKWIELNKDVILEYWEGKIGTIEFSSRLKSI
jgi:hypothetical protein